MDAVTLREFLTLESADGSGEGDGSGSGYGYGYGYGYGSGYGDGYGDGDGDGDGSGDGSGSGSGYGDGYGSGYGYGYGDGSGSGGCSGDGYGSGDGSGYGYGDGSGVKSLNGEIVVLVDEVPTIIRSICGNVARGAIVQGDLTLRDCWIVKQDGFFAHGDTLRGAMEAMRVKLMEDMPEDERIDAFLRETDRKKPYPAQYFYDWHHRLTGSCDMGRKAFAKDHGIDLKDGTMTLHEFLELTKNAYGGEVIRRVLQRLEEETECCGM
nr:MAG TPA: hypothetical protein [Caudoviricetes sp.]